ncbi:hypothetical protein [Clostridium estertheticum]|uniref:Uncharacterized protein n=1 Tax=Clostridium estertheticum TaxID=238834 RepID=A0A7Y3WT25_9CLOT|nr:hypothetical protein [Clostridium estertheticum]MBX4271754.1 hypothetical protein [Clostridium estertheticum]NNU76559.1 hypothetical protein [Clostridium estertheticum]WBL49715.1 hypothetical protein LOR37_23445 [Clostridium estertheticum]WLC82458.1 hypothetical protein KTC98_24325 [Clostridium estertheticum]
MSKSSEELEVAIQFIGESYDKIPLDIPKWMIELGIRPGARILHSKGIGSKDRHNKTDVLLILEDSEPLKISAKLSNADYFGNWYGHVRFLEEFGEDSFWKLTKDATNWANWWMERAVAPFVGVSICFGKRSGNTARRFLDIFTPEDILSICRGYGDGNHIANCLYSTSDHPQSLQDLFNKLNPITHESINSMVGEFMIAYRPINPLTEYSNRGKNVYTKFQPYEKSPQMIRVSTAKELFELGEFVEVTPNRVNHNHILNDLYNEYNIFIPKKEKA